MQSSSSAESDASPRRIATRLPRDLRCNLILCGLTIGGATACSALFKTDILPTVGGPQFVGITAYFFQAQDARCLAFIAALLIGFAVLPWPTWMPKSVALTERQTWIIVIGTAIAVGVIGVAGNHLVFSGFHLARDEVLADFDAIMFRAGKVIAPIDPAWQAFGAALQPRLMLPIAGGFAPDYLPVNSALRVIVGFFGDRSWTNPILAAVSILATYGIGQQLFPSRRDASLVSVLLLATSSQLLVTAMTSYAMTAHLAFNLIWLWLFLRNGRIGHVGALVTGFLACGLHQLIFHPLFAAPFIFRLWVSGRRPLALVYATAYMAIGLFWIFYWKIVLQAVGMTPAVADDVGSDYFVAKILVLLSDFNVVGIDLTLKNILRFIAWQGPMLLSLAALAYPALKRDAGIARELLAGLLLTLVATFILLPYQGHGWGYRYIHGLIGSMALLGGYGWIALSAHASQTEMAATRSFVLVSSLIACLVLFPIHAISAHDFAVPYRRAVEAIRQQPTDVVVVESADIFFGQDLVRNDPFQRNRPKLLDLDRLTAANIADLCAHDRIAVFDAGQAQAFGIMRNDKNPKILEVAALRALLKRSCPTESVLKNDELQHPLSRH